MSGGASLGMVKQWLKKNSPLTAETLRPGMTLDQLEQLQLDFQIRLLPDAKRLWLWHDGCAQVSESFQIVPPFYFIGSQTLWQEWTLRNEVGGSGDPLYWDRKWVPIGSDWSGNHLVIDHSESESHGNIFVADVQNGRLPDPHWVDLRQMLDDLMHALLNGGSVNSHVRVVRGGRLEWQTTDAS